MPQSAPTPDFPRPAAYGPLRYRLFSAAGNRFAVLDTRSHRYADPARVARTLCGPRAGGAALDGALFVGAPEAGGDCRMILHNADGSRAEACGNGLRCVALFARQVGLVGGARVQVETDRGLRAVELLGQPVAGPLDASPAGARSVRTHAAGAQATYARAAMGPWRVLQRNLELEVEGSPLAVTCIDVGNPHCVVLVPDVQDAPVARVGAALEVHSQFPAGTNVEFVARAGRGLRMRVWERGVGETGACGTGACAAALATTAAQDASFTIEVASPGGTLTVERDEQNELWLTGPCEAQAWVESLEPME